MLAPKTSAINVGIFSNNTAAVSWTQREEVKTLTVAGRLIKVLALRKRVERTPPLVAAHVAGDLNVLG